jgi:hypothetical protein
MTETGLDKTVSLKQLKETVKRQTFLVRMDEQRALDGLTALLPKKPERQRAMDLARELLALGGPISAEKEARLQRVAQVLGLETAAPPVTLKTKKPVSKKPAAGVKAKAPANRNRHATSSAGSQIKPQRKQK